MIQFDLRILKKNGWFNHHCSILFWGGKNESLPVGGKFGKLSYSSDFLRPILFTPSGRPSEVLKKQCGVRARTGGFLWFLG